MKMKINQIQVLVVRLNNPHNQDQQRKVSEDLVVHSLRNNKLIVLAVLEPQYNNDNKMRKQNNQDLRQVELVVVELVSLIL